MSYDLCGIGNALLDIIVSVDDDFITDNDIARGQMRLVDDVRAADLYAKSSAAVEMSSGGSAANSLAGFASLGGHGAFMGKVGRDQFGEIFTHDLQAQKIRFTTTPSPDLPTGRCFIFVTPDAQRSMNTCLGAAGDFCEADIDRSVVENAAITYLEGYLFDKDPAQEAFRKAARIAHQAGRKLALTLSDVFCVGRHRNAFLALVDEEVDILFANEDEIRALYQTADLAVALAALRDKVELAVVTRGEKGAVIASGVDLIEVPAHPVARVIDTTGAGDLYAAGFLFGLTRGKPLAECGRIGAIAAGEVISHYGPRPQVKLSDLI